MLLLLSSLNYLAVPSMFTKNSILYMICREKWERIRRKLSYNRTKSAGQNPALMYRETQDSSNASQTEHSASVRLITPVFFRGIS